MAPQARAASLLAQLPSLSRRSLRTLVLLALSSSVSVFVSGQLAEAVSVAAAPEDAAAFITFSDLLLGGLCTRDQSDAAASHVGDIVVPLTPEDVAQASTSWQRHRCVSSVLSIWMASYLRAQAAAAPALVLGPLSSDALPWRSGLGDFQSLTGALMFLDCVHQRGADGSHAEQSCAMGGDLAAKWLVAWWAAVVMDEDVFSTQCMRRELARQAVILDVLVRVCRTSSGARACRSSFELLLEQRSGAQCAGSQAAPLERSGAASDLLVVAAAVCNLFCAVCTRIGPRQAGNGAVSGQGLAQTLSPLLEAALQQAEKALSSSASADRLQAFGHELRLQAV